MGGLLNGATVDAAAKKLLAADADDFTWAAAAIGSQNAASYQLATGDPVMAIGGFNGSDPSPTLSQFKKYVEDGRIHYFISSGTGGGGGMGGSGGTSSQISTWVEKSFEKVTMRQRDLLRPDAAHERLRAGTQRVQRRSNRSATTGRWSEASVSATAASRTRTVSLETAT